MNVKTLRVCEYFFSPISPWSYLGHQRLLTLAQQYHIKIDMKPMDNGQVFAASGGVPLAKRAPQRQTYRLLELQRWSDYLEIPINVQSLMRLLQINTPRNVYQAQCRHILYDSRCTLSQASYTTSYTVGSATQNSVTASAAVPAPSGSGTYQFGKLKFTSGANNGVTVTILQQSISTFLLYGLLPYLPSPGDTFTVSAGCDKQTATCSLFGNLVNFGGTPNIPIPEVTVP